MRQPLFFCCRSVITREWRGTYVPLHSLVLAPRTASSPPTLFLGVSSQAALVALLVYVGTTRSRAGSGDCGCSGHRRRRLQLPALSQNGRAPVLPPPTVCVTRSRQPPHERPPARGPLTACLREPRTSNASLRRASRAAFRRAQDFPIGIMDGSIDTWLINLTRWLIKILTRG